MTSLETSVCHRQPYSVDVVGYAVPLPKKTQGNHPSALCGACQELLTTVATVDAGQ